MGLDHVGLLVGGRLLLLLAQLLDQGHRLALQPAVELPADAGKQRNLSKVCSTEKNLSKGLINHHSQFPFISFHIPLRNEDITGKTNVFIAIHLFLPAGEELHELLIVHVQELVEVHSAEGELPEGTLLLKLGGLEKNKRRNP